MILQGLKPRIFDQLNKSGRKWLQELPAVVWSLRTTPSKATRFTPFFLVHGTEAVLPTNLEYGSPRVRGYDEDANQSHLVLVLDTLGDDIALRQCLEVDLVVGSHHPEGLLDAKMQRPALAPGDVSAKARRRLASELPACASPSSTARQVSRAAVRNSNSSCSEEL
jgi:hypothetical protein